MKKILFCFIIISSTLSFAQSIDSHQESTKEESNYKFTREIKRDHSYIKYKEGTLYEVLSSKENAIYKFSEDTENDLNETFPLRGESLSYSKSAPYDRLEIVGAGLDGNYEPRSFTIKVSTIHPILGESDIAYYKTVLNTIDCDGNGPISATSLFPRLRELSTPEAYDYIGVYSVCDNEDKLGT